MDVDLDFPDREKILDIIQHIPASIITNGVVKKHNTGVYCQRIPINPLTNTASIDYKEAERRGYFKIDFLNVSAYVGVVNEAHLIKLMNTPPIWDLLHEKEICDQLTHINGYHSLLAKLKPTSIQDLAMVLALMRPGKKHESQGFESIKDEIWTKPEDGNYYFKHSHSVGYAHLIVMQLNLLIETLSNTFGSSN